jgi:Red chlorophyll catabolite reductase (RCC reductase)
MSDIKSVVEMLNERPDIDNSAAFATLWEIFRELRATIDGRFRLQMDPSTAGLQPYHGLDDNGAKGMLSAWVGDELDWFVHSWIGNPKFSFTNMHLTLWLGPQTRVPHLAYALATVPDVFFYMDYIPRVELVTHPDYLDTYYTDAGARHIEFLNNKAFTPFVSKSAYVRESLSPSALCFTCKPTEENFALIRTVAHEMLNRWIGWLDAAKSNVPTADERESLGTRDLFLRRTIAERDPANVVGDRLFGKPLTEQLVRALWGGDRVLPRLK